MTDVPTFAIGIDDGNSYFTAVRINEQGVYERVTFPSASKLGRIEDIASRRSLLGNSVVADIDALEPTDHVLKYNKQSWFVGDRAFRSKDASTSHSDPGRYSSLECRRNVLTGIAALLPKDIVQCNIVGVMCLPLTLASDPVVKEKVKRNLNGPHDIEYNGRKIRIQDLKVGRIVAEGIGPAIRNAPADDRYTIVFDSGYYTFDYATLRGMKAQDGAECGTINKGVRNIADHIISEARNEYGVEISQARTEDILRAYIAVRRYQEENDDFDITEMGRGREHREIPAYPIIETNSDRGPVSLEDMERWVRDGCNSVGYQITAELASRLGAGKDGMLAEKASTVYFVGGGFYFFRDAFRPRIPARKITVSSHPEFDTADGLAYYARALLGQYQNVGQVS
jgi:hypothetical protein